MRSNKYSELTQQKHDLADIKNGRGLFEQKNNDK